MSTSGIARSGGFRLLHRRYHLPLPHPHGFTTREPPHRQHHHPQHRATAPNHSTRASRRSAARTLRCARPNCRSFSLSPGQPCALRWPCGEDPPIQPTPPYHTSRGSLPACNAWAGHLPCAVERSMASATTTVTGSVRAHGCRRHRHHPAETGAAFHSAKSVAFGARTPAPQLLPISPRSRRHRRMDPPNDNDCSYVECCEWQLRPSGRRAYLRHLLHGFRGQRVPHMRV